MSFQFELQNCNRVRDTHEKWKGVTNFGAKISNCLKTMKGSALKEVKKDHLSGCLMSPNLMD